MNLRCRGMIATCSAAALAGSALFPAFAGAAPIDDKRKEAAAIQDKIDANGEKISILAEDFNQASIRLDEAQAGMDAAAARIEEHLQNTAGLKSRARARAVVLYQRGKGITTLSPTSGKKASDIAAANRYMKAATMSDDDLIDQLRQATAEQEILTAQLKDKQQAARDEQANITAAKNELEAANAEQASILNRVQGELAVLVEEERKAREARAAEEYRRQQQAAAERAAAKAARDATSTTSAKRTNGTSSTSTKPANETASTPSTPSTPSSTASTPTPAPTPTPPSGNPVRVQTVINFLYAQLGDPYVYGGSGPDSWDCSGLVQGALNTVGISTPHGATAQGNMFPAVQPDQAQPGDIFMFNGGSHDGIYIGNGQMIHAPQTGDVVKISPAYRSNLTRVSRPPY